MKSDFAKLSLGFKLDKIVLSSLFSIVRVLL